MSPAGSSLFSEAAGFCWVVLDINEGPLSLCSDRGSPKRGTMSFNKALSTSCAFSVRVKKASFHPVKVSIKTRRYNVLIKRILKEQKLI